MTKTILKTLTEIGLFLLLASCGGGGGDKAPPTTLKSEAGYIEIEPVQFTLQQQGLASMSETSSTARVMYTFHPAVQDALNKPIFVFLNGGPGCATTTNLFSMNTAPYTLDRERTSGSPYAPNPYSWAAMGNLLYIDAQDTGFSYNVVNGADQESVRYAEFNTKNFNPFIDSANVIRVLLRFLDAHPDIRANQVVLVGESYSGTRISTMLNLLLFHPQYATDAKVYTDTALVAEIQRHFSKVFSTEGTTSPVSPEIVARQFGRQILIQPEISGPYQAEVDGNLFEQPGSVIDQIAAATGTSYTRCNPADTSCDKEMNALNFVESTARRDRYNYLMPLGWTDDLEMFAMQGLLDVDVLSTLFGIDVRTINLLKPSARSNAYRYLQNRWEVLSAGAIPSSRLTQQLQLEVDSLNRKKGMLNTSGNNSMENVFGSLPIYDDYLSGTTLYVFVSFMSNDGVLEGYPISPDSSPLFGQMFLENITLIKTFLTDAEHDLVIYSPGYPEAFKKYTGIVKSVEAKRGKELDGNTGSFRINYQPSALNNIKTPAYVDIFYPYYPMSGHSVPSAQPDKLLADVKNWMQQNN